jgi:hypothetical protein
MTRVLVLLVLWCGQAAAQPAGAQAETLFRQGRELLEAGKIAEACAAFDESEKLDPAITTLINLAGCREKNGQLATAWGLFLEAERKTRGGDTPTTHQLHDVAADRARKLEPRVSKLTVNVPQTNGVDGLEVTRNGERIDAEMWNRALPIDGGKYTVSAKAPGSSTWTTEVTVAAEADTKTVDIPDLRSLPRDLAPKPIAPVAPQQPRPEVPPPAAPHANHTLAIAVGAGSVALLGGGLGFELWGESKYDSAKSTMVQSTRDSLYSAANTRRYTAEGLAAAGVVGAGVTVWLILRHHDERPTRESRLEVVPTGTGLALWGSY